MKNDSVSLTIDGKPVQVPAGTSLLLAAKENNIDIPTLCYHPELKPEGHCRLCVVEIGAAPRTRLVNSCTYPAEPGLVVATAFRFGSVISNQSRPTRMISGSSSAPSMVIGP